MALWLNRSGRRCEHETRCLEDDRICLTWGGLVWNLGNLKDCRELMTILEAVYPKLRYGHRVKNSGGIPASVERMAVGDWICVSSKRKTIHIGEITRGYTFEPAAENQYSHHRTVKWLETDVPRKNYDQGILNSLGVFNTVCQIKRHDAEARVRAMQTNGWKSVGMKPKSPTDEEGTSDEETGADFDLEQLLANCDKLRRISVRTSR